jgi:radical SAM-linked protein
MAPDIAPAPIPPIPEAPTRDKVRLRFRKSADLRLLSHHDLMRTFERMLRRAAMPVRRTQGFHPHPRIVFALSLPLGVVGCAEVVELELDEILPLDEIRTRLTGQCPPGMDILSIERIASRRTAQVRRLCYRVKVPQDRVAALRDRITAALAAPECVVERKREPVRRVDLKPWLSDLRIVDRECEAPAEPGDCGSAGASPSRSETHLEMVLWLLPSGTARPDEVLQLLELGDLLDEGFVVERAWIELHEEGTSV